MGYFKDAIKGVSWIGSLRFVTRGISVARIAILARILSPAQFGLVSIASLSLVLIETFTETGVNIFLMQQANKIESYINSAWIVSIVRGICISLLIIILSPFVSQFFGAPDAYSLLLLTSVVPFIRGFINPAVIIFQKELRFNNEFYFRSVIFFIDSATAVVIVIVTLSPSSIIWGLIAGAVVEVILSFVLVKPIPRFSFERSYISQILHKGKWLTMAGIFSYLFHNLDNIVVGKIMGTASLGFYDIAYKISMLPITEVADVISKVTLPVYSKISGDRKRIQKAFIRTLGVVTLLTVPVGIIFFMFPETIISLIVGPQWLEASSVLMILAAFGIARSVVGTFSPLFLAVGKENYVTVTTGISFFVLALLILPLVSQFGLIGAGYSVLIASIAPVPILLYFLFTIFKNNHLLRNDNTVR